MGNNFAVGSRKLGVGQSKGICRGVFYRVGRRQMVDGMRKCKFLTEVTITKARML